MISPTINPTIIDEHVSALFDCEHDILPTINEHMKVLKARKHMIEGELESLTFDLERKEQNALSARRKFLQARDARFPIPALIAEKKQEWEQTQSIYNKVAFERDTYIELFHKVNCDIDACRLIFENKGWVEI